MTSFIYLMTAIVVCLQVADYYTTSVVLKRGGLEVNPILRWLFKVIGTQAGLIIAKLWASGFVIAGAYYGWFDSTIGIGLLSGLIVLYLFVIINNYFVLRDLT